MSTTAATANRDSSVGDIPILDLDRHRDPEGQPLNAQRLALARLLADGCEWELPALRDAVAVATGSDPATVKKTIQRTEWLEIEGFGSGRRASRVRLAAGVRVIGARTAPSPSPLPSMPTTPPTAEDAPLFAALAPPAEPPSSPISEPPPSDAPSGPSTAELDTIMILTMVANLRETIEELTAAIVRIDGDQTHALAGLLETIRDTIGSAMRTAASEWAEQRQREWDVVRGELAESRQQTAALAMELRNLQTTLANMPPPAKENPAPPAAKRAAKRAAKSSAKSSPSPKPSKTKPPAKPQQRPSKPKPKPKQKPKSPPKQKPQRKPHRMPREKPESSVDLSQRIAATVRRLAGANGWADNAAVRDALGCNASNWSRKVQRAMDAKLIRRRQKGAGFQLRAMGHPSSA